jgi:hypothetical protein
MVRNSAENPANLSLSVAPQPVQAGEHRLEQGCLQLEHGCLQQLVCRRASNEQGSVYSDGKSALK